MYYKQLHADDRKNIERWFYDEMKTISEIAILLNRNKSTISRELKRNTNNGYYDSEKADYKHKLRSQNKYLFRQQFKFQQFNKQFVKRYNKRTSGVKSTWALIKKLFPLINIPSWRQIFRWIKTNGWYIKKRDRLRLYYKKGGKRSNGYLTRFNNKYLIPYWTRPKYINNRQEIGHYELDTIIGKRANGFENVITLVERVSRKCFLTKVKSKNIHVVNKQIETLIKENNLKIKSITIDNGIEFNGIGILAKRYNFKVYVCEPYASHQRGTNEHLNGILRRWYKKGTDFNEIPIEELKTVQDDINNMRREIFNWKSSNQIFHSYNQ